MRNVIPELDWLGGFKDVRIELGKYGNGTMAVQLFFDTPEGWEELLTTASTNLEGYDVEPTGPEYFFIKTYSEHEFLADALIRAGVIQRTEPGRLITIRMPHHSVSFEEYRFAGVYLDEYLNHWAKEEA